MLKLHSLLLSAARIMSAAASKVMALPSSRSTLAFRRFMVCCFGVAQRQLAGEYPLEDFFLSNVVPVGRGPISLRKFANPFSPHQRFAMETPAYAPLPVLQRWCMAFHEWYSRVREPLCLILRLSHPQFSDCPSRSDDDSTARSVPQSHRHIHIVHLLRRIGPAPTSHLPKRLPVRSMSEPMDRSKLIYTVPLYMETR